MTAFSNQLQRFIRPHTFKILNNTQKKSNKQSTASTNQLKKKKPDIHKSNILENRT